MSDNLNLGAVAVKISTRQKPREPGKVTLLFESSIGLRKCRRGPGKSHKPRKSGRAFRKILRGLKNATVDLKSHLRLIKKWR